MTSIAIASLALGTAKSTEEKPLKEKESELAMPQFSATLLGLLGISAGTYVGFKLLISAGRKRRGVRTFT